MTDTTEVPAERERRRDLVRDRLAAGETLLDIGRDFGLTAERIRQIAEVEQPTTLDGIGRLYGPKVQAAAERRARREQAKKDEDEPTDAPAQQAVIVHLPGWLMRSHGLQSRELVGVITRRTAKAIMFRGIVSIRGTLNCLRCGRELERKVSRGIGYGPDCCEHLGIPWNSTEADARRIVATAEHHLTLPLSQISLTNLDGQAIPDPPYEKPAQATKIARVGDSLHVTTPFEENDRVRSVTGSNFAKRFRVWTLPASPVTATQLVAAYEGVDVEVDAGVQELLDIAALTAGAEQLRHAEDLADIPGLKNSAWGHQRRAFWFSEHMPATMFAMGMGTGKSLVTVGKTYQRASHAGALTLIVCPLKVTDVWPREFRKHADYPVEVIQMASNAGRVTGTIANRLAEAKKRIALAHARGKPAVVVINYEAVWRVDFSRWADKQEWDLIVCDESQRIKAAKGKAVDYMAKLGRRARYRACLTGTPLSNSPLDIYGQYRFLDPGIFGTSFARFRNRYAVMGGYGGYEVKGYQNQAELAEKIYSIAFKVGQEVLDLPEAVDAEPFEGPLEAPALKLYREITEDLYSMVGDAEFTAANVLTRLLRQQQLTGGAINDDEGVTHEVDTMKEGLLLEWLQDVDPSEPIVVFTRFTHDLDVVKRCAEATGRRYGELSGRRRDALTDEALMAEDRDIVGVQIQSGGQGIDLTRARYCAFFSLGFSLTDYLQARARVHRPGQDRPVTYYHFLASNVDVDKRVYAALEAKENVVRFIMDEMGREPDDDEAVVL